MRKIIPLSMALALAVAVVGFTGSAGAQVTNTDTADCVLTGVAGTANADDPANNGVQNITKDAADGNLADTDSGDYTFSGDTVCAFVDDNGPPPDSAVEQASHTGVYPGTITSEGRYVNTVCGTGTADGTPGLTSVSFADNAGAEGPYTDDYHIQFVAGQGALTIAAFTNNDSETGDGAGEITIEPTVGNCVTTDVEQFTVAGDFAVTIPQQ